MNARHAAAFLLCSLLFAGGCGDSAETPREAPVAVKKKIAVRPRDVPHAEKADTEAPSGEENRTAETKPSEAKSGSPDPVKARPEKEAGKKDDAAPQEIASAKPDGMVRGKAPQPPKTADAAHGTPGKADERNGKGKDGQVPKSTGTEKKAEEKKSPAATRVPGRSQGKKAAGADQSETSPPPADKDGSPKETPPAPPVSDAKPDKSPSPKLPDPGADRKKNDVKAAGLSEKADPAEKTKPSDASKAEEKKAEEKPEGGGTGILASLGIGRPKDPGRKGEYDPEGKVDPFAPLFKEERPVSKAELEAKAKAAEEAKKNKGKKKKKKKKRCVSRTPLQRLDLSQLKLVGIIRAESGERALVQEASGKGYVITKGTLIGIHCGRVTEILRDKVIVEEEEQDISTDETRIRKREMRLPKPLGESYYEM